MTDVEVYRRVKLRIVEFLNHVRAYDANLRRPVCDECGDIKGAHADDRDIFMIGREFERPAMLVMEIRFRFYVHAGKQRSEEHTSELQSLMRNSYAVLCLNKKTKLYTKIIITH